MGQRCSNGETMTAHDPKPILLWPGFYDWQRWVAISDEDELETTNWHDSAVFALRWIDANESEPNFENLRAGFRQRFEELSAPSNRAIAPLRARCMRDSEQLEKIDRYWSNFTDGLKSPDADQRQRFTELEQLLRNWSLPEAMPILACLERAIFPKGRKGAKATPSKADRQLLARMKPMILHQGINKTEAARAVASEFFKPHMLETTVKRLVRGWNWKMSRRQFREEK